jgi:hypothetical protein
MHKVFRKGAGGAFHSPGIFSISQGLEKTKTLHG